MVGKTFGLTGRRGRGGGGGFYRRGGTARDGRSGTAPRRDEKDRAPLAKQGATELEDAMLDARQRDEVDERMGFYRYSEGSSKLGWLVNMHPTLVQDDDYPGGRSAVDYYFLEEDGGYFKSTLCYEPYFFVACRSGMESEVEEYLRRKYEGMITSTKRVKKEDLKMPNHLLGYERTFIQLSFLNVPNLLAVRREIMPIAFRNRSKMDAIDAYAEVIQATNGMAECDYQNNKKTANATDAIIDIREYDVPFYLRVAIDLDIRVGKWYTVTPQPESQPIIACDAQRVKRAEPVVLAFDIEVTKAPLKFPDSAVDQIMMISYMIDGAGYLITNREIVSAEIDDFEYSPAPEYSGPFIVFNEDNEEGVIRRFFDHIKETRPTVIVTYNGDSFDFPFVEARANFRGINMLEETGFAKDSEGEYKARNCAHMDCFRWVKRDSYLPQGSQGLKAVTTAKLGYHPLELDPELMTPYAQEQPQILAQYSVSDAVATYYLYMKYVHPFIFSLCNIIPLNPDEVLRKGSGTLCETLLMVEAYQSRIIMPNKHTEERDATYNGHLLATETYVGGHVEALEAGVFRSDIPTDFKIMSSAIQQLIDDLDRALVFSIEVEGKLTLEQIENYDEVRDKICHALVELRDNPIRKDTPFIYHLDVAAMYPNIMLSNRLQPDSVVDEATCAACDYNRPGKQCDRRLPWSWRGEYYPAKRDEYNMIKHALTQEKFPGKQPFLPKRNFEELSAAEQSTLIHQRLGIYSRKVYKHTHVAKIDERQAIICQRENPFYIDTVREFRDRRYEYKGLHKKWKKTCDAKAKDGSPLEVEEAKKMIVLYDSLQLAHKCILNSFYGYVMRKGARWYSMEMAGVTCLTCAKIIQLAKDLVEKVGRPLELDTDGIWCMLPSVFPENFKFTLKDGGSFGISYPCTMLNHLVHQQFTNHQYHALVDKEAGKYEVRSENSIFFEVDGPYRAMVLPSSQEEDKLLKKRYAVFNDDGSMAELKGFEMKRRGELQLIKIFQSQIFERFLIGTTLQECYAAVAKVADSWLDVLHSKAVNMPDEELINLISENRSMSRTLEEYGTQKSTSISTARRLAEFLGSAMTKDKGLACKFIISARPQDAPVTERAIPVAIFSAESPIKKHFLRKWLRDNSLVDFDIRSILDWSYYIDRLGGNIQKLITIPAAIQKVPNPVPRIRHPDWLHKRVDKNENKNQTTKLKDMWSKLKARPELPDPNQENIPPPGQGAVIDIEDFGNRSAPFPRPPASSVQKRKNEAATAATSVVPDIDSEYGVWLQYAKKAWKKQRLQRRRRNQLSSQADHASQTSTTSNAWDVVSIAQTNEIGVYRMWTVIQGRIQPFRLKVPRIFYLNFKEQVPEFTFPPTCTVERLSRTLPRGESTKFLHRVTISEEDYLADEGLFSAIITHPKVNGCFELNLPLSVRAILQLGCSPCPLTNSGAAISQGLNHGFELSNMAMTKSKKSSYLNDGRSLPYCFLFYIHTSDRHIFSLCNSTTNLIKFFVTSKGRDPLQMPDLYSLFESVNAKRRVTEPGAFDYATEYDFEVLQHKSLEGLSRALDKELGIQQKTGALLVVYSSKAVSVLKEGLHKLNEFAILEMPFKALKTKLILSWQVQVCTYMLRQWMTLAAWLRHECNRSARFNIPICNFGMDKEIFAADICFARHLHQRDMLVWWSSMDRPDLGGREEDDNLQYVQQTSATEMSNPGCYETVCIEVDLLHMAPNVVLQSALLNDMEGSTGQSTGADGVTYTLDDYAKNNAHPAISMGDGQIQPATFALLKTMLREWHRDLAAYQCGHCDTLINHFWRWLSSRNSCMYEPAIHQAIFGMMRKAFMQMISEFKRLGAGVVHANLSKIYLLTNKPSVGNALAYANYILGSIQSRPLFANVCLEIKQFWEFLLWMDPNNYAGIICKDPSAIEPPLEYTIEMIWDIQQYLATGTQQHFEYMVRKFIDEKFSFRRRLNGTNCSPIRKVKDLNANEENSVESEQTQHAQQLVSGALTRKMLKIIDETKRMTTEAAIDPNKAALMTFPRPAGAYLEPTVPALELIKAVCAVFELAEDVKMQTRVMKRNLLDVINVREFSEEASFKDPCETFKLSQVICQFCTSMRDMDLCRDRDLLPPANRLGVVGASTALSGPGAGVAGAQPWQCPECHAHYDKLELEGDLIGIVQDLTTQFQLQDLRCGKCRQVKGENLLFFCTCSGKYQLQDVSRVGFAKQMRIFQNLARVHSLKYLDQVVEWTTSLTAQGQ